MFAYLVGRNAYRASVPTTLAVRVRQCLPPALHGCVPYGVSTGSAPRESHLTNDAESAGLGHCFGVSGTRSAKDRARGRTSWRCALGSWGPHRWELRGLVIALCALLGITSCTAPVPSDKSPRLELSELWTSQLPDSFDLAGVTGSMQGLVLWSHSKPYLLERDSTGTWRQRSLATGRSPVSVHTSEPGGHLYLLDTTRAALTQTRLLREDTVIAVLPGLSGLESAAVVNDQWFVGTKDSVGSSSVWALGRRSLRLIFRYRSPLGRSQPVFDRSSLDCSKGTLILTGRWFPFVTYVLDAGGAIIREFTPNLATAVVGDSIEAQKYVLVATRTLPLDRGFLQVLSDPYSLRRVLILYDLGGNTLRVSLLNAPVGFVHSIPDERILIAYRHLDRPEIVAYRWRWVSYNRVQ